MTADIDVVVFNNGDLAEEALLLAQPIDALDQRLAIIIGRMRLAGEDQLYGTLGIVQEPLEPLLIMEDEGGALVGCKAAGESQGQRLRVEHVIKLRELPVTFSMPQLLPLQACAQESNQLLFAGVMGRSNFLVGSRLYHLPYVRVVDFCQPVLAEIAIIEGAHFRGQPRSRMHTIGDVFYRDLIFRCTRPQMFPHAPRYLPVQSAHAVVVSAQAKSQDGHAELGAPLVLVAGQVQEAFAVDAHLTPVLPEKLVDQLKREGVMACGHWRMGREDIAGSHDFDRSFEFRPCLHQFTNAFQAEECAVAFVHVPDGRFIAQRSQSTHASNAQYVLLADTHFVVTAVEPGAEFPILMGILLHVCVHKVKNYPAHLDLPYLGVDSSPGKIDMDDNRIAL